MEIKLFNLGYQKDEGVFYCTSSSKEIIKINPSGYGTIKVYGRIAEHLRSSIITSFISRQYYCGGICLFQISFDDKCTLGGKILDETFYDLDKLSNSNDSLLLVQNCGYNHPCFDNSKSTNILFFDWVANDSDEWSELIKFVSTMAGLYSHLSPPSIKAAILNSISSPLSHTVCNDGSFDYMKCLYSSDNHVNMHIEDCVSYNGEEKYTLFFPLMSRKIRISITAVTFFKPNDPAKGEKYIDGIVTINYPGWQNDSCCIVSNELYGNIHRVRMELNDVDLSRINYQLPIIFKSLLLDGGNVKHIEMLNFYAAVTVENIEDDGSGLSFYEEILRLNYVSNLNVARRNHYIV